MIKEPVKFLKVWPLEGGSIIETLNGNAFWIPMGIMETLKGYLWNSSGNLWSSFKETFEILKENTCNPQGKLWNSLRDAHETLKKIYEILRGYQWNPYEILKEIYEIPMKGHLWNDQGIHNKYLRKPMKSLRDAYEILKEIYEILKGCLWNP